MQMQPKAMAEKELVERIISLYKQHCEQWGNPGMVCVHQLDAWIRERLDDGFTCTFGENED